MLVGRSRLPDLEYEQLAGELISTRTVRQAGPQRLGVVRQLLQILGSPEKGFKIIHVAGTNGKGLTSTLIARLLEVHTGTPGGLFTSPHLMELRERIAWGGHSLSRADFVAAARPVLVAARQLKTDCSFFDLLTATAMVAFDNCRTDNQTYWAVLETGLGGVADATNAIPKEVAVITRLGLDHQAILGHSLRQIATQKMGIAHNGLVVLAAQNPQLENWMSTQLRHQKCRLIPARLIQIKRQENRISVRWPDGMISKSKLAFSQQQTPPWQAALANALAVGWSLWQSANASQRQKWLPALCQVHLPARLDLRCNFGLPTTEWSPVAQSSAAQPPAAQPPPQPLKSILLDGAHNPQALAALARQLRQWKLIPNQILLVLAKERLTSSIRRSLNNVLRHSERVLLPALLPSPINQDKIASPSQLKEFLGSLPVPILTFDSVAETLKEAFHRPQLPLVATGSFWLMGEILPFLEENKLKHD